MGFQCFPGKKTPKKYHRPDSHGSSPPPGKHSFAHQVLASMNEDDSEDEKEQEQEKKIHKVAWRGPKLEDPFAVQNLDKVIQTMKAEGVVFNNGATPTGRKSDENLYNWIEEYCRLEHKKKKLMEENMF